MLLYAMTGMDIFKKNQVRNYVYCMAYQLILFVFISSNPLDEENDQDEYSRVRIRHQNLVSKIKCPYTIGLVLSFLAMKLFLLYFLKVFSLK